MLYLVLLLVVASLGLLIAALTTANTLWAWISVLISVAAAGLLVLDWVRNRRRRSQAVPAAGRRDPEQDRAPRVQAPPLVPVHVPETPQPVEELDFEPLPPIEPAEPVTSVSAIPVVPAFTAVPPEDPNAEPAEENTDATDRLVVSELSDEVVVIDERPRYHLGTCGWLGGRPTLALAISEARDLGFTPCGKCSPDAALAARHRAERARS
ncbi:MAG: hypothetical protein ABW215_21040 [Kibdelosporangium sp.]